ncbi:MAG: NlpC/P60 family protein [Desulfobacterales bacterium]|jgi:cell wall-associated NlpC family hydrolase
MMNHRTPQNTTSVLKICSCLIMTGWLLLQVGCGGESVIRPEASSSANEPALPRMRYTIQVGAFSNIDNAVRLTEMLQREGLDAYHFLHSSGLYKVRFENFRTKLAARSRAENLKRAGIIDEFYIVGPRDYTDTTDHRDGNARLREEILKTARQYIGVPYRWGGESPQTGFDCSGLTMVVYRINGLDLPRSSGQQWKAGKLINRRQLKKGDLVFFATSASRRVSHVGIYAGGNLFLHAPGKNRRIQTSSMSNKYYSSHYVGARSYL